MRMLYRHFDADGVPKHVGVTGVGSRGIRWWRSDPSAVRQVNEARLPAAEFRKLIAGRRAGRRKRTEAPP
jgi:hypothetical protein